MFSQAKALVGEVGPKAGPEDVLNRIAQIFSKIVPNAGHDITDVVRDLAWIVPTQDPEIFDLADEPHFWPVQILLEIEQILLQSSQRKISRALEAA